MKKLSTILGIGVLSMAVGLAPATAQQAKPQDSANAPSTVQSTTDKKPQAAPAVDSKAPVTVPAKPATDVKTDKAIPATPAPAVKSEAASTAKPVTTVKDDKSSAVKSSPPAAHTAKKAKHGKKHAEAMTSKKASEKAGIEQKSLDKKSGMTESANPAAGK